MITGYIPNLSRQSYAEILESIEASDEVKHVVEVGVSNPELDDWRAILIEAYEYDAHDGSKKNIPQSRLIGIGFDTGLYALWLSGVIIPRVPYEPIGELSVPSELLESGGMQIFAEGEDGEGYLDAALEWAAYHYKDEVDRELVNLGLIEAYLSAIKLRRESAIRNS